MCCKSDIVRMNLCIIVINKYFLTHVKTSTSFTLHGGMTSLGGCYSVLCFSCVQRLQLLRDQLQHQRSTYQLIAVILRRLNATQELSGQTRRRLKSLESWKFGGVGIHPVLCQLQKMIVSLDLRAGNFIGEDSTCADHGDTVNRIISELTKPFRAPRVQASYIAAVLSVTVRQLLQSSALDVACLQILLRFLPTA